MAPVSSQGFWEKDGELFEYPPELCVKNTFIDCKVPRSPGLDGFYQERRIRSCPSSGVEKTNEDDEPIDNAILHDNSFCSGIGDASVGNGTTSAGSSGISDNNSEESAASDISYAEKAMKEWRLDDDVCDVGAETPQASCPTVLDLGNLITEESADDGPVQTNIGSQYHSMGHCKPCAFFHTKGCESGDDCIFCHECDPGEKKLRRKEKQEARKMLNYARARAANAMMNGIALVPVPATIFYF